MPPDISTMLEGLWAIRKDVVDGWLFAPTKRAGEIHLLKLSGVGRVSVPALRRNDNCPPGRPCCTLFHTLFAFSSSRALD